MSGRLTPQRSRRRTPSTRRSCSPLLRPPGSWPLQSLRLALSDGADAGPRLTPTTGLSTSRRVWVVGFFIDLGPTREWFEQLDPSRQSITIAWRARLRRLARDQPLLCEANLLAPICPSSLEPVNRIGLTVRAASACQGRCQRWGGGGGGGGGGGMFGATILGRGIELNGGRASPAADSTIAKGVFNNVDDDFEGAQRWSQAALRCR